MRHEDEIQKDLDHALKTIDQIENEPFTWNANGLLAYWKTRAGVLSEVLGRNHEFPAGPLASGFIQDQSNQVRFEDLSNRVSNCKLCPLHEHGQQCSKIYRGGTHAQVLMVIDQEPDDEDLSILKPMMEHEKTLNLPPFSYNITWSLRCTPKEGFLEEHKSVTICAEYTREHVYILNPQVIIALGRAANMQLTDMTNKSMDEVRKNGYFFYHYPVVPSFGLKDIKSARNDVERSQVKQKIFRDLKKVRSLLQGDNDE